VKKDNAYHHPLRIETKTSSHSGKTIVVATVVCRLRSVNLRETGTAESYTVEIHRFRLLVLQSPNIIVHQHEDHSRVDTLGILTSPRIDPANEDAPEALLQRIVLTSGAKLGDQVATEHRPISTVGSLAPTDLARHTGLLTRGLRGQLRLQPDLNSPITEKVVKDGHLQSAPVLNDRFPLVLSRDHPAHDAPDRSIHPSTRRYRL
jgi:hypothetical protein